MTTKHTHDEQSGADLTAAEQPYVPAFVADSTLAEVAPSVSSVTPEEQAVSNDFGTSAILSDLPAAGKQELAATEGTHETPPTAVEPSSISIEETQPVFMVEGIEQPQELSGTADVAVETTANVQAEQVTSDTASQDNTPILPVTEVVATVISTADVSAPEEASPQDKEQTPVAAESVTAPTTEIAQAVSSPEQTLSETLPSFTAFIEEFRQAEARLNVSRQDSVSESFEAFALFPTIGETSFSSMLSPEQVTEEMAEAKQAPASEAIEQTEQVATPSSRFRFARSGAAPAEEQGTTIAEQPGKQVTGEESVGEQEPRRPARRYRFDRPATANISNTPTPTSISTPARGEEAKELNEVLEPKEAVVRQTSAINGNGHNSSNNHNSASVFEKQDTQSAEQATQPTLMTETAQTAPGTQEASSVESSTPTPTSSEPERRRRHGSAAERREKEQATPAAPTSSVTPAPAQSTQETITPITEQTSSMIEEIAPEDLPPLEYADLQKNNGRRRRRHRPGTPVTPSISTVNSNNTIPTPMPLVEPTQPEPTRPEPVRPEPIAPAAAQIIPSTAPISPISGTSKSNGQTPSPYSIVSGYTVSQMNQGDENTGPFMGPEPSPARGSVLSREGRTLRAETQRMPIYPTRGDRNEGASASSIHQLSSVLSQAIQTQTDRMVAELRRANQAPTNVSVSIPPFPSTERVGVFVDVANLLYSARTMRISIDFGKLLDFLRGNRRLIRAHAYCPTSPQAGDEQMFLQAVKGLGYRITTKNYKTFASGAKKADLDLDLCMDIVRLVDGRAVDCVVLVSGDSDFMPVLDYCSDHGVRVEVAAFDEAMSATLRQSCDLFINLSMLQEIRS